MVMDNDSKAVTRQLWQDDPDINDTDITDSYC
jgi:hypothetical protein